MSRSIRKSGIFCNQYSSYKKNATRKFRRYRGDIKSGCMYKKLYESYNIKEWIWRAGRQERQEFERYKEIGRLLRDISKYTVDEALALIDEMIDCRYTARYFYK